MIIETKFNIGDIVYIINNGQIIEVRVSNIQIEVSCGTEIKYLAKMKNNGCIQIFVKKTYYTAEEAGEAWLKQNGLNIGIKSI